MSTERYEPPIEIVNLGGAKREVLWAGWTGGDTEAMRASCSLFMGHMAGHGTFSLGTGWGSMPLDKWRICDEDLALLRVWAASEPHERRIRAVPKSPGRKRRPRRGRKVDPRQEDLFE